MVTALNPLPGTAIMCLTRGGCQLGLQLAAAMGDCRLFVPQRLALPDSSGPEVQYFGDWNQTFAEVFNSYQWIICIMAAGIVVRSLAVHLQSKYRDPAVVVVDEKGQYAISLLAGHLGGANRLAVQIAQVTGGRAVITTATDVQGKTAADVLAVEIDAVIDPPQNLKLINRCLAEDQPVYLYSPWPVKPAVVPGYTARQWPGANPGEELLAANHSLDQGELATPAVIISPFGTSVRPATLGLKPRNLVVGIGCRRGVDCQHLWEALDQVLEGYRLDRRCIRSLASLDLKAEESGIIALAEEMGVPFQTFRGEEIAELAGTYPASAWVEQMTGVGGVCEPAARLGSHKGMTLVPKQKIGPVTISVAMERSWWWDWGQEPGSI